MATENEEHELLEVWENEFSNRFTSEDESFMKVKNAAAINPPAIPDWGKRSNRSDKWKGARGPDDRRNGGPIRVGGRGDRFGGEKSGNWARQSDNRDNRFHREFGGKRSYHRNNQHNATNRWNDRASASASTTTNGHLNDNAYVDNDRYQNRSHQSDHNQ